ncbi:mitochondrial-processing peptidase subunit beta isoform X2 [Andrena cerasifolii]|uniref:mitochondrial-processing peptidase subunit beta isoform X2 n=1 Tax=Andrena cerasifolii TaxID=2819439 RepID=UPI00403787AB
MVAISNYLCRIQSSILLKYVQRGYVSVSNNRYKTSQDRASASRKGTKGLDSTIESSTASNGMHLVCECRSSFTTTLGCFVPAGSMHERLEERGSALFLQHLFFRRTVRKNQEQLEVALQEIGGKVAAIAMRDMFLFYGTVPSHRIDKLVQFLADVILNGVICMLREERALFDTFIRGVFTYNVYNFNHIPGDGDVRREKYIILHELGKMESDRERVIMDYLPTMAYQDTTLANSIYPTTVEIKNFCTESLNAFRSRLFQPCFMTMVCSGSICLNDLERTIIKYFPSETENQEDSSNVSNLAGYSAKPLEYRFSGAELRLRDDDEELGYVAVAIEGPGYKQRDHHFALNVAKEIVERIITRRISRTVRTTQNCVICTDHSFTIGHGLLVSGDVITSARN